MDLQQIIIVVHVLIALAIIGLILLQQGKGADMGASFGAGASQTLFGSDGSGNVLTKATAWLVALFFATSFGLALLASQKSVVVDDIDMGVTHVTRGDDHINNTPRQINIYEALGAEPPVFAHVPMILGEDGARLSKRHGAVSVLQYREMGYLPQALLNYLVRLGWSHGDQEIFTLDEMVDLFRIGDVNRKAAAFDHEKLNWLNQHWMRSLPPGEVAEHLRPHMETLGLNPADGPSLGDLVSVQAERCKTLVEMAEQSRCFYEEFHDFDPGAAKKHLRPVAEQPLRAIRDSLADLDDWTPEALDEAVRLTAAELEVGMGKVAQPLRVALTGTSISPSIDKTLWLCGQGRSLARITHALEYVVFRASQQG